MKKLTLEINNKGCAEPIIPEFAGMKVLITPPLNKEYWLFRVAVSPNQAVVAFPKFGIFGIGFQNEKDWNTNLPSDCSTEEIYNHIKHNKGNPKITKKTCIQAIKMLQEAVTKAESK